MEAMAREKEPKRKKTVRFQVPEEDPLEENVTYVPTKSNIEDDIFHFSEVRKWKTDLVRDDLLYGKFSKDEDEKIKKAVYDYIKSRGWEENKGLQTVLCSAIHRDEARGCWVDIAKCLPQRPVKQINARAHILLGGERRGKWSQEEKELLRKLYVEHGPNWKKIAVFMGRSGQLCKDKWRHLKMLPTRKTGPWTAEELDKLCMLVRRSLRVKAGLPPKKLDRRAVKDDINWEWISTEMQRDDTRCAEVWYEKLASPMVREKKWANGDDRLLLQSLMEFGAASEEAVDWDSVLDHRDSLACMERWKEMTRLLGATHDHASFEDKIEVLAKRYAPDLLGIEEECT